MMTKSFYSFVAISAALLCVYSCGIDPDDHSSVAEEITIHAFSGDTPVSKTSRGEDGTFYWSWGDQISVFYGSGAKAKGGAKFTTSLDQKSYPSKSTDFKGELDTGKGGSTGKMYWGVYPYSEENDMIDDSTLRTFVPTQQTAAPGTYADGQFVSIGRSETREMGFYNLCGGIMFQVKNENVHTITLYGNNGETLAGQVDVVFDENNRPVVKDIVKGSKTVTLTCKDGFKPNVNYFIVTLPVTLTDGFTVEFDNGYVRNIDVEMTVSRSKFQWSEYPLDYEEYEYYVMDEAGRAFLNDTRYETSLAGDYTSSIITEFPGTDKPLPYTMSCDGIAKAWVSTSPAFDHYYSFEANAGKVDIYNLIPGVRYYLRALDSSENILQRAIVKPVGPVRWINGAAQNMRDLGGWTVPGGQIAYGKVFRGGRLDSIQSDPAAKDILFNILGVDIDLDLRGLPPGYQGGSGENNPWTPSDPIEYHNIQLWHYLIERASQYDPALTVSDGTSSDQYQFAIRQIIGWLAEGKVVYFHCHGGSDRTGTLAFLIEALLGVSDSDLSKDYELTYFSGSTRQRNGKGGWYFPQMVKYLQGFAPQGTISEQVELWAKTKFSATVDPLTDEEIALLRQYLIEK